MPGVIFDIRGGIAFGFFVVMITIAFMTFQYEPRMSGLFWATLWFFIATGPLAVFQSLIVDLERDRVEEEVVSDGQHLVIVGWWTVRVIRVAAWGIGVFQLLMVASDL